MADQSTRDATSPAQDANRTLSYQLKREWKVGDVYAPKDLSPGEMKKWGKRTRPTKDVFDILSVDPLSLYKVSVLDVSLRSDLR